MTGFIVLLVLLEILMTAAQGPFNLQMLRERVLNARKQGEDAFGGAPNLPGPEFFPRPPPGFPIPNFLPGNDADKDYEYPPNGAARYLVETFKDQIKEKTKAALHVNGPDDERQLAEAPIAPLAFLYFKQEGAPIDVYYIRVLLGRGQTKIFHAKLTVRYGSGGGLFKLDGQHNDPQNRDRFKVTQVIGPKEENDRLNRRELNAD